MKDTFQISDKAWDEIHMAYPVVPCFTQIKGMRDNINKYIPIHDISNVIFLVALSMFK